MFSHQYAVFSARTLIRPDQPQIMSRMPVRRSRSGSRPGLGQGLTNCRPIQNMKQCHICRTYSPDTANYCGKCRSTYAVKLCRNGHINPATVSFCLNCGSEELSRPDRYPRKLTKWLVLTWVLLTVLAACLIAYAIARSILSPAESTYSRWVVP